MTITENILAHTHEMQIPCGVFPKYSKMAIFNNPRNVPCEQSHEFTVQMLSEILEGHVMQEQVHMQTCIPPKNSVSQVVGNNQGEKRNLDYMKLSWGTEFSLDSTSELAATYCKHSGLRQKDNFEIHPQPKVDGYPEGTLALVGVLNLDRTLLQACTIKPPSLDSCI